MTVEQSILSLLANQYAQIVALEAQVAQLQAELAEAKKPDDAD